MPQSSSSCWTAHPVLAAGLKVAAHAVPIAVSVVTAALMARLVDRPTGTAVVLWWLGVTTVATLTLVVVDRLMRRLLPLTALLKLSLVFPDETPKRFLVAFRAGSPRHLRRTLADVDRRGLGRTPQEAAERVLDLVAALSRHDRLTRGHCERVRAYSRMIGEEMRLSDHELHLLQWAGLLHDVGKLRVPGEILNKPGRLTPDEYEAVKIHPQAGFELVEPLVGWLGEWASAVLEHHERWDGRGYPAGLAGTDISLAARIVSVADVYDVMTSIRSYKKPVPAVEARAELTRCAGSQFDERVVRAFLSIGIGRLRMAMGPLSWLAQLPFFPSVGLSPAMTALSTVSVASIASATAVLAGVIPPNVVDVSGVATGIDQPGARTISLDDAGVESGTTRPQSTLVIDTSGGTTDPNGPTPFDSTASPTMTRVSTPVAAPPESMPDTIGSTTPPSGATAATTSMSPPATSKPAATATPSSSIDVVESSIPPSSTVTTTSVVTTTTVPPTTLSTVGATTTFPTTTVATTTTAANHPPMAVDDVFTMALAGGFKNFNVRQNDTDPDGDPLNVIAWTQGDLGSVSQNGNGTLRYTPTGTGVDTFTYTVSDGRGGTATATVTVTIT